MHILTGGAEGADMRWLETLHNHCSYITVCTFLGHRLPPRLLTMKPTPTCMQISLSELRAAGPAIDVAAQRMGKHTPGPGSRNLIARNHLLASMADCLVAVGTLLPTGSADSVCVDGGTGWTVQMFADRFEPLTADTLLNAFFFDGTKWMQLVSLPTEGKRYGWKESNVEAVATAAKESNRCGFVGSRLLTPLFNVAIRQFELELQKLK
jgi:hypothetical protein